MPDMDRAMSDNELRYEIYGRVFTVKTSSCGYDIDEAQDVTIGLMAESKGTFLVGKRYRVFDREIVSQHKFKVPYDWAVGMRRRLLDIKVPAFPYMSMGCDGGFTELRAGECGGGVRYKWWCGVPDGWEELDSFACDVISLFDVMCKFEEQRGGNVPELVRVCPVAGIGFAEGAGKAIEGLCTGDSLELVREKDNRHDANAVAVVAGVRVGYVHRKCNADIASMIDEGRMFDARVLSIGQDESQPKMEIALFLNNS